ncbi:MAG: undecaprenyl-diphosphate phosphatase [Actinomycetota bacterium]|nr:undecaprenyl-diphosphate phosphatase [Actinomycetota bacterium]
MTLVEALVLGVVQGLTEFLPISSSAHLVLVPRLAGWAEPSLPYLVLLHAGTLVALFTYFWRDLLLTARGMLRPGSDRRFLMLLILGTLPAAVIGAAFETQFESAFGKPFQVALQLVATGVILVGAEALARRRDRAPLTGGNSRVGGGPQDHENEGNDTHEIAKRLSGIGAVFVGLTQAFAIVPGISRSGATIAGGLLSGLTRAQAARFSFLLAVPILFGTSAFEVPQLSGSDMGVGPLLVGFVASAVSSYAAIATMIGYLQRRGLFPFALYCLVVGSVMALLLA